MHEDTMRTERTRAHVERHIEKLCVLLIISLEAFVRSAHVQPTSSKSSAPGKFERQDGQPDQANRANQANLRGKASNQIEQIERTKQICHAW